ncbi:DNA-directed DNA polymerase B, partial [mine drainage metagenome]
TGTKGKFRQYRGAFVDLKTLTAALTGEGHSLKSAGEALGCSLKKTEADYRGKVTADYLGYCLNDVDLTDELYGKCLARYADFNLPEHPSRVFSAASLGKAAFRARAVSAPKIEDKRLLGRIMAAFYAGKVECRVVGREIRDVAILDFTSQHPSLFCLLGADRFLRRSASKRATR